MELIMDGDLQAVAEFMQSNVPAAKLVSVADSLTAVARLLWSQYPQEPCTVARLLAPQITMPSDLRPIASGCALE
jgi:hypothetical protein